MGRVLLDRWTRVLGLLVPFLLLVVWLVHLDTPFSRVQGFADWIGNHNGRIAGNYVRYGLSETKGAQILNLEEAPREDWVHYQNHPAALDLLTAAIFRIVGSQRPWVHRLLPLVASTIGFFLLFYVARVSHADPWLAVALYAAFPVVGVHGINLSYEPLCLSVMLGAVLLYERGRRWSVLPLVYLGGLIDYPVLYLVPVLAVAELVRSPSSGPPTSIDRRLLFAGALVLVAVASFATHVAHVLWTTGDLRRDSGQPWHVFMLASMTAGSAVPVFWSFLERQIEHFTGGLTVSAVLSQAAGFTWPGLLIGAVGAARCRRNLGLAAWAFLVAGAIHLFVFRAHAFRHDFWPFYFAPFFALAGAMWCGRLPRRLSMGLVMIVAVLGLLGTRHVWQQRARIPVREIGQDLARIVPDPTVVLHGYLGSLEGRKVIPSPGWAVEIWRGHPVVELADLLDPSRDFQLYLDGLARYGYLDRPQMAVVSRSLLRPGDREWLDRVFPGAFRKSVVGTGGSYLVYNIGAILLDPGRSPELADRYPPERLRWFRDRARMHLVLPIFPPGSRVLFLDGSPPGQVERFRGRWVRTGGEADLPANERWTLVAWPGTPWAERLERVAGERLRRYPLSVQGSLREIPYLPPAR